MEQRIITGANERNRGGITIITWSEETFKHAGGFLGGYSMGFHGISELDLLDKSQNI